LSRKDDLGTLSVDRATQAGQRLGGIRVLLPLGWLLAATGYYGPWIAHGTAALTLSGSDMGEFVKFLPGVLDGTLTVARQLFYLPPLAVVLSVGLLVGSAQLGYPGLLRAVILFLAVPVSLQLLPPAWSIPSLTTPEFRAQTIALGVSWLFLAGFCLWGRVPPWLTGSLSAALSLAALGLVIWQFLLVKPAIDQVYGRPPTAGWGLYLCMVGLVTMAASSLLFVVRGSAPVRSGDTWTAA
jgi:hypothetical protein